MGAVAQFLASLAAILVLAWIAHRMGLGRDVRIRDADHAKALADEVICGFAADDAAVDDAGRAALVRDRNGRTVLIKVHGAQFSGRLLGAGSTASVREDHGRTVLEIDTGERLFGRITLDIDGHENWVQCINPAKAGHHA